MSVSNQNVIAPFDTTGYTGITGAQLKQLVEGLRPFTDKGNIIVTTDSKTTGPDVPDPANNGDWKRYIWKESSGIHNDGSGANLLKWYEIAASTLGPNSITNAMLSPMCVTDDKILNVNQSKIYPPIGSSGGGSPSGAAGGDLTGSYPNPSVASGAITTDKIADIQVTGTKIAPGVVDYSHLASTIINNYILQKSVGLVS